QPVPFPWRIHPDSDRDSQDRSHRSHTRGPDDEPAPQRLILSQRREIEPMGNRAEICPEPGLGGRILHNLTTDAGNVHLLAVRPGVLPKWTYVAKRSLHGP